MKLSEILKGRLPIYLLFWAVSFYVCLRLFSRTDEIRFVDVIYTFLFHIPFVFAVTFHSSHLMKHFLAKRRFYFYGSALFNLFFATYFLYQLTFDPIAGWLFPDYYLVGVYSLAEIFGFTLIYLLLSSSLEFSRSWFSGIKAKTRVAELESEKSATELNALKAQVNPHFLFNSLNAIYGESLKGSVKTPNMILQLSDMLRYVLDKMEADSVPLKEEVDYLQNYVDMQMNRLNHPEKVQFNLMGELNGYKISPLLLINFIENCFKHADLQNESGFIRITIRVQNGSLKLNTQNTTRDQRDEVEQHSELGIDNARKRLELAYPNAYTLDISEDEQLFEINLNIDLNT
jgi:hypothetical protein